MKGHRPPQVKRPARPWPVTALSLFLLAQAAGLHGLGISGFAIAQATVSAAPGRLDLIQHNATIALVFIPLGLLAGWASAGFFRLWPNAWLNAILLQGLILLASLSFYFFASRPVFAYLLMLAGIFMTLYLNHSEVQSAFRSYPAEAEDNPEAQ